MLALPRDSSLQLWYKCFGEHYDCSATTEPVAEGVTFGTGRFRVTRKQMISYFFDCIRQPGVIAVFVTADGETSQQISQKTVERIKSGALAPSDLLIEEN